MTVCRLVPPTLSSIHYLGMCCISTTFFPHALVPYTCEGPPFACTEEGGELVRFNGFEVCCIPGSCDNSDDRENIVVLDNYCDVTRTIPCISEGKRCGAEKQSAATLNCCRSYLLPCSARLVTSAAHSIHPAYGARNIHPGSARGAGNGIYFRMHVLSNNRALSSVALDVETRKTPWPCAESVARLSSAFFLGTQLRLHVVFFVALTDVLRTCRVSLLPSTGCGI